VKSAFQDVTAWLTLYDMDISREKIYWRTKKGSAAFLHRMQALMFPNLLHSMCEQRLIFNRRFPRAYV
jgi:hypothetical protein